MTIFLFFPDFWVFWNGISFRLDERSDCGWSFRLYSGVTLLALTHSLTPCLNQSQSHIATDGQSMSKSWCRAPSVAHDQIFITLWQLRSCFCGAPSLTRGRVCLLYMLLTLTTRVRWDSRPYFTFSDLRLPFSSLPTTRRVNPWQNQSQSQSYVTTDGSVGQSVLE
jgi:hypothetical protein